MEEMREYYEQYMRENRGKVKFDHNSKLTSYSFEVETLPQKDEQPKKYVVMKSWFAKVGRD